MANQISSKGALWEKSLTFSIQIVEFSEKLCENRHNWKLADQLLRSGCSIGANIREASSAESNADFVHKYLISLKECRETLYWLEVLLGAKRIGQDDYNDQTKLATELESMLSAAVLTMKAKMGRANR